MTPPSVLLLFLIGLLPFSFSRRMPTSTTPPHSYPLGYTQSGYPSLTSPISPSSPRRHSNSNVIRPHPPVSPSSPWTLSGYPPSKGPLPFYSNLGLPSTSADYPEIMDTGDRGRRGLQAPYGGAAEEVDDSEPFYDSGPSPSSPQNYPGAYDDVEPAYFDPGQGQRQRRSFDFGRPSGGFQFHEPSGGLGRFGRSSRKPKYPKYTPEVTSRGQSGPQPNNYGPYGYGDDDFGPEVARELKRDEGEDGPQRRFGGGPPMPMARARGGPRQELADSLEEEIVARANSANSGPRGGQQMMMVGGGGGPRRGQAGAGWLRNARMGNRRGGRGRGPMAFGGGPRFEPEELSGPMAGGPRGGDMAMFMPGGGQQAARGGYFGGEEEGMMGGGPPRRRMGGRRRMRGMWGGGGLGGGPMMNRRRREAPDTYINSGPYPILTPMAVQLPYGEGEGFNRRKRQVGGDEEILEEDQDVYQLALPEPRRVVRRIIKRPMLESKERRLRKMEELRDKSEEAEGEEVDATVVAPAEEVTTPTATVETVTTGNEGTSEQTGAPGEEAEEEGSTVESKKEEEVTTEEEVGVEVTTEKEVTSTVKEVKKGKEKRGKREGKN